MVKDSTEKKENTKSFAGFFSLLAERYASATDGHPIIEIMIA